MMQFDYEELVKATDNFSPSRLIGKGSHGRVYKGFLQDDKIVAIKMASSSSSCINGDNNENLGKLANEISVLSSLTENPFVVNFLGASKLVNSVCNHKLLVMEFMPNGSLFEWLHVAETPPPWHKRVETALQIARTVGFLHASNPCVIHRDIKSANILLDLCWNASLADFGLAVLLHESAMSSQTQLPPAAGTIGYMDPEYTIPSKLSVENDVFSLGVVLLEIFSGRKVMDGGINHEPAWIVDWSAPSMGKKLDVVEICNCRVSWPEYMHETITSLLGVARRCVLSNEENRPSIEEVIMDMQKSCSFLVVEPVIRNNKILIWININVRKLSKRILYKLVKFFAFGLSIKNTYVSHPTHQLCTHYP